MTTMKHNALLRQTRSVDVWWSAPLSNLAAMRTNWFSDRLKKIKPAIKTSRKVLNGPYVHNKLSYVFFPSSSSGHSSYLQWQVRARVDVHDVDRRGGHACSSCCCLNFGQILWSDLQNQPQTPADGTTGHFSHVAKSTFRSSHSNSKKGATFII